MDTRTLSLCVGTLLLFVGGASAADVNCKDPVDQMSMNICAGRDYKSSDKKLNTAYQALSKTITPGGLQKLKSAQKAWIAYRDAQCDFDTSGHEDGSIYPMIQSLCLDALTQAQTTHLNEQLHCEEGNLSCGNQ